MDQSQWRIQTFRKGGGDGYPDPEIRWEGRSQKKFFSALKASVWSKNKEREGGGGGGDIPWIRQ